MLLILFTILFTIFLIMMIVGDLDIHNTYFGNVYRAVTLTVGIIALICIIFVIIEQQNTTKITDKGSVPSDMLWHLNKGNK